MSSQTRGPLACDADVCASSGPAAAIPARAVPAARHSRRAHRTATFPGTMVRSTVRAALLPGPVEFRRARRLEVRLPALQAGDDTSAARLDALAEFRDVGLAFLAHLLGLLGALLHSLLTRGRELGLVRLHALRDPPAPGLDVAAEFLRVLRARPLSSRLGVRARCDEGGKKRECYRLSCISDRHAASCVMHCVNLPFAPG